jgi:SNF2 family DNA or RNA helicase
VILSPETPQTVTIARIYHSGNTVLCSFRESNDTFRKLVKAQGLRWSENYVAWSRAINPETAGEPIDRCCELAAKLINGGFACDVSNEATEKIKVANWTPEHKRWVKAIDNKFHLWWRGTDENLYARAQMLPGSSYDHDTKAVSVPPLYYAEVEGFAQEHDFHFTTKAQELLESAARDYSRVVMPAIEMPIVKPKRKREHFCDVTKFADLPARNLTTTTELYPHQVSAVEKLLPVRVGGLFMDMGTGKTRAAIELAALRQQRTSRVIWFCPVSLKITIATEIQKHSQGEQVYIFDETTNGDNVPDVFWYVVGIESISASDRVVLAVNKLIDTDTFVIVDESTYIKGYASKRSMRIAEMGKRSRYRLLLTGTPLTQGVEDLYAQMRFLSPDILGYNSFYSFARNHLEYSDKYKGLIVKAKKTGELAAKIAPFVYQVTKEECLDLPDKLYDQMYFGLTSEQREAYEQAKCEILLDVEEPDSYVIFQLFTALQQIVSGFWNHNGEFVRFEHFRVDTLKTAVAGIPENDKVIIWCKFVESVHQIQAALPDCALYYGELSEKERNREIDKFRNGARFLLATQATGGHGLTLNEAHYHIFYENEFKYSHRIQAEDRSHRIGQTMPVTYIDIVSKSGIDDRIVKALSKKQDVVKAFRREVKKVKDLGKI